MSEGREKLTMGRILGIVVILLLLVGYTTFTTFVYGGLRSTSYPMPWGLEGLFLLANAVAWLMGLNTIGYIWRREPIPPDRL